MIQNITDDLHQSAGANVSIGKLYKLFSKFLDLCAPLVKAQIEHSAPTLARLEPANKFGQDEAYTGVFDQAADRTTVNTHGSDFTVRDSATPRAMEGWDDNLVWELFDNQPSLGWAESELWSAIAQFDAT